jgi:hypothetical protein
MKLYPVERMVYEDSGILLPTFAVPLIEILKTLKADGALAVIDPLEAHTKRQRAWYKGVCLPTLAENGDNEFFWDHKLKSECNGLQLLNRETFALMDGSIVGRLTTKGVSKTRMTQFIESILTWSQDNDWPVLPPDEELRR